MYSFAFRNDAKERARPLIRYSCQSARVYVFSVSRNSLRDCEDACVASFFCPSFLFDSRMIYTRIALFG